MVTNKIGQVAGGLSASLGSLGTASLTDKLATAQGSLNSIVASAAPAGLTPAQLGLGSVESNANAINSLVQGGGAANLAKAATSVFGSNRTASPLDTVMANNNANNNGWGEG